MSRSVRARGLKLCCIFYQMKKYSVALRAGAWIETSKDSQNTKPDESRSVRARGLKLAETWEIRGEVVVALRAGAWIETIP